MMELGDEPPLRLLIHDRDTKVGGAFDEVFRLRGSEGDPDAGRPLPLIGPPSALRGSGLRATSGSPDRHDDPAAERSGRPNPSQELANTLATATAVACAVNKKRPLPGLFEERMKGLEPSTFCMASGSWFESLCVARAHGYALGELFPTRDASRHIAAVSRGLPRITVACQNASHTIRCR